MKKGTDIKKLIGCIALPLAVGGLSALMTKGQMQSFELLNKPPLSPPGWLFPIVWSILYILMGIACYIVIESDAPGKKGSLKLYGLQLAVNFFWSLIFFNLEAYLFAFFWLLLLWVLILSTIYYFSKASSTAAWLLSPYLIWVTFAGYLNLTIFLLNR